MLTFAQQEVSTQSTLIFCSEFAHFFFELTPIYNKLKNFSLMNFTCLSDYQSCTQENGRCTKFLSLRAFKLSITCCALLFFYLPTITFSQNTGNHSDLLAFVGSSKKIDEKAVCTLTVEGEYRDVYLLDCDHDGKEIWSGEMPKIIPSETCDRFTSYQKEGFPPGTAVPIGDYPTTFSAFAVDKNTGKLVRKEIAFRIVVAADKQSPEIKPIPSQQIDFSQPLPDFSHLVIASDNCTPSDKIKITQSPSAGVTIFPNNVISHVKMTATDAAGNQTTTSIPVTKR